MNNTQFLKTNILLLLIFVLSAKTADAYIGPGAGLGLIGFLIAVIVVIIVIFLGLILYPLKVLKKFIKRKKQLKKE